jgi:hypothetical protein
MTAQVDERLILNGENVGMSFCPPLPEGHPRIVELDDQEAGQRDDAPGDLPFRSLIPHFTAYWRHCGSGQGA